jgi:hypothetical protein
MKDCGTASGPQRPGHNGAVFALHKTPALRVAKWRTGGYPGGEYPAVAEVLERVLHGPDAALIGRGVRLPAHSRHPCYPLRMDRDEILRVLRAFEDAGLEYVLIGAAAMGVHGLVRATEDVDLFIKATAENVERLRAAFRTAYDGDPNVEDITAGDLLGDYPAIRYYPPSGDLYFDVMTRLGEAASYETVDAERRDIAGVTVHVASPRALYRLKRHTVRAKDRDDAAALKARFGLEDEP